MAESVQNTITIEQSGFKKEDYNPEVVLVKSRKPKGSKYKFCLNCGNILVLCDSTERKNLERFHLCCLTCPYIKPMVRRRQYTHDILKAKTEEIDIVSQSKADEHRQRTETICPQCTHSEAFFYQMQTRSADEPMTTFYECANKECRHNWRD